ncbi:MAG: hypothetical protein V1895_03390 [Parcubacteria group bacterium]
MSRLVPPKTEAKKRVAKLRELIARERFNVHVLDKSTMSEAAHWLWGWASIGTPVHIVQ